MIQYICVQAVIGIVIIGAFIYAMSPLLLDMYTEYDEKKRKEHEDADR